MLIDVDEPYAGAVVEKMSRRKGELSDIRPSGGGKQRLTFRIPARGLIGYHGEFLTDTRGTGVMNRLFAGYGPWKGEDRRPPQRRADLLRGWRGRAVLAVLPAGPRRRCSSPRAKRSMSA